MADQVTTKPKYVKKYKCPYCDKRYERQKLINHIDRYHSELILKDYTATRVVFNLINKKDHGTCIICGKEAPWNENKARYDRLCGSQKCHDEYVKIADKRTKDKYGKSKIDMLNDPEFQEKMLANRSISGEYTMRDGTKKKYVGSYEKKFLEFMDQFFEINSEDLLMPGPVIDYKFKEGNKTTNKKWITDAYYIPYNLVLDIKDGGDNPNNREMESYRKKQIAKEKAIASQGKYNYLRLTNNNFEQLIEIMLELKERLEDPNNNDMVIRINEDCSPVMGTIVGSPSKDTYVVNYMMKNSFTGKDEEYIGICSDKYMSDIYVLHDDKFDRIPFNEFRSITKEATNLTMRKTEYPMDIKDITENVTSIDQFNNLEIQLLEEITPFTRYLDIMQECLINTINESKIDTRLNIPLIALNKSGATVNFYRDINGVYAKNIVSGIRSSSYESSDVIPKDVIQFIQIGKL